MLAEIGLEFWVERHVARVIAEEIKLRFVRARAGHVEIVERIPVGRDRRHIAHAMGILPIRCPGDKNARRASRLACECSFQYARMGFHPSLRPSS